MPDGRRRLFEVDGVPFGIAICHEGWRYPESVRWAATRGARLVFHPQLTGSDRSGMTIERWGDPDSPYYEKAMVARSVENTIYFASVNYAMRYQDSATSLIGPEGECLAHVPYGRGAAPGARRRPVAGDGTVRPALQPGSLSGGRDRYRSGESATAGSRVSVVSNTMQTTATAVCRSIGISTRSHGSPGRASR